MNDGLAFRAARVFMCCLACVTLNEQQITCFVGTIYMRISGCTALMAMRDNITGDMLAKSRIKHKVFSSEFIGELSFLNLPRIINDAPMQLIYILEAVMFEVGRCFFTTYTPGTIKQNGLFFLTYKHM